MTLEESVLGVVEFSDTLCVSDPGYGIGTWSGEFDLGIKPGQYKATTLHGEYRDWGERNWRIMAVKEDEIITEWEFVKELGVDSASMSIICRTKYEEEHNNMISLRMNSASGFKEGVGFVCDSGCGDGGYGLYQGRNMANEVCAVSVSFLFPEDKFTEEERESGVRYDDQRLIGYAAGTEWWKTEHETGRSVGYDVANGNTHVDASYG